jgi:DNA-binding NarL/FixJ family response regulator
MSVRIAVLDPLPMFRRGIREALGGVAFEPETPSDLMDWVHDEPRRVVLLTMQSAEDWALLTELRQQNSEIVVVAMLQDVATTNYIRAILSGASAVVPRDAQPEYVQRVLDEAMSGRCLLPIEVVRALSSSSGLALDDDAEAPSPQELQWLRQLARGATVGRLANDSGYSERAMYRLLGDLYRRIGARNRTEALLQASQRGWL